MVDFSWDNKDMAPLLYWKKIIDLKFYIQKNAFKNESVIKTVSEMWIE